ncbi:MAG: acyltransferase [Polyangiaceae bacterium]
MQSSVDAAGVEPPPIRGRIPQLDGLRGLAILLVLIWHYLTINSTPKSGSLLAAALFFTRVAWSGVDLFFVLSGFLIGGILFDARAAKHYFIPFYVRRFFRIVPIYAVVVSAFFICAAAGAQHWWGSDGAWFFGSHPPWYAFVGFFQNVYVGMVGRFDPLPIMVTWSLCIEEQFYLTLPFIIRFLPQKYLLPVFGTAVVLAPLARLVVFMTLQHGGAFDYSEMPLRADSLLLGTIAAILVRDAKTWQALVRKRGQLKLVTLGLGAGILIFMRMHWTTHESEPMCTIGYSVLALFYLSVLLLAVTRRAGLLSRILTMRWLMGLGTIAYGTYLLHVGVNGVCFGILFGHSPRITSAAELATTFLATGLTIAIAKLSWTFFEKRLVKIGHRFPYDPTPSAMTSAPAKSEV